MVYDVGYYVAAKDYVNSTARAQGAGNNEC